MKKIKSILILSLFMLTASCSVESMQKGSLTLKMTDDPADYAEVNVEILDVEVHYADGDTNSSSQGWISLETKAGVYDLLELQDSVTAVLADSVELPVGKITQMRLILGSDNYILMKDSSIHELDLSSQMNTGIKLNLNADIKPSQEVEVLIDFDAGASIIEQKDAYKLKPVIKVLSVE